MSRALLTWSGRAAAGLLLLVPFWSMTTGCNSLLGIENAELDPLTSSSGGSSTGVGGTDGTGASGTGGSGGGANECGSIEVGRPELVRGCLLRISCDPLLSYYSMSECVSYSYQLVNAHEACTYGALDCGDIERCLGRRWVAPGSCTSSGWTCVDGEAIQCGEPEPYALDCAVVGSSCVAPAGFPDGLTAPCVAGSEACSDAPEEWHCDGSVRYECIDGARYGQDCAATASTCVESTPGQAMCLDSTTSCATPGSIACNGNVVTYCGESGLRSVLDCGAAGLRCETIGSYADCVAPACTLEDVVSCAESCDGARLRYCVGGAHAEVDCAAFGFTSCEETLVGDFPRAYCVGSVESLADSCIHALDGECDEPLYCDPGTDTTDCNAFPPGN